MWWILWALIIVSLLVAGCAAPEEGTEVTNTANGANANETTSLQEPTPPTDGIEGVSSTVIDPTPSVTAEAPPTRALAPEVPPPAPTPAPSEPAPPPAAPTPPPSPTPPSSSPSPTPVTPTPPPPTWPREGSFVRYTTEHGQSFGGSDQFTRTHANLSWTFTNGDWRGECDARHVEDLDGDGVIETHDTHVEYTAANPPHWPLFNTQNPPAVGEKVEAWTARGCVLSSDEWTYKGETNNVHTAGSVESDVPFEVRTTWSDESGLVMEWFLTKAPSSAPSYNTGRLTATDAPGT